MLGGVGARQFPGGRLKSHLLAARRIFTTRRHLSVLPRPMHSMTYIDRSGSTAPRRGGLRRAGCGTFHVRTPVPISSKIRTSGRRKVTSADRLLEFKMFRLLCELMDFLSNQRPQKKLLRPWQCIYPFLWGFFHQFIFVSAGTVSLKQRSASYTC